MSIQGGSAYSEYGCDLAFGCSVFDHSMNLSGFRGVDTFGLPADAASRSCGGEAGYSPFLDECSLELC